MEGMKQDIIILTGAGITKESGLDTFRDEDGIWSKVRIEDVATPDAYQKNPKQVQDFYNVRRQSLIQDQIKPNEAHEALARLEKVWIAEGRGNVTIVTQNIDNLHERAGSKNIIHMHGEILKARCEQCATISACMCDLGAGEICSYCAHVNTLRPHVVWFGEMPLEMDRIHKFLEKCNLFVSIGTSGNVYPAAGFVQLVRLQPDTYAIELNLEPSEGATLFDEARYGPATNLIPSFVEELIDNGLPLKNDNRS